MPRHRHVQIIGNEMINNVGKSESCMVSKHWTMKSCANWGRGDGHRTPHLLNVGRREWIVRGAGSRRLDSTHRRQRITVVVVVGRQLHTRNPDVNCTAADFRNPREMRVRVCDCACASVRKGKGHLVCLHIIRYERLQNVDKSQSCMVSQKGGEEVCTSVRKGKGGHIVSTPPRSQHVSSSAAPAPSQPARVAAAAPQPRDRAPPPRREPPLSYGLFAHT